MSRVTFQFVPSGMRGLYDSSSSSITLGLEDPLDAQHLLHLVLHRQAVLEQPCCVGTDRELPRALVLQHPRTECRTLTRVTLETQQVGD